MTQFPYRYDEKFDYILGAQNAPVTIVAYESYTCPHCAEFMQTVFPKIFAEFIDGGNTRYVLREVYFDEPGVLAAAMLRAIPRKRFFKAVEELYANQREWLAVPTLVDVSTALIDIGIEQGADEKDLVNKMQDTNMEKTLIEHSQRHIANDDVQGTPTIIINGQKAQDWSYETVSTALNRELTQA